MLGAKGSEFRIGHRRNRQDRRQKYVVNGERHNASLPRHALELVGLLAGLPLGMVSLGANIRLVSDGIVEAENAERQIYQTDDITVVIVQRFK